MMMGVALIKDGKVIERYYGFSAVGRILMEPAEPGVTLVTNAQNTGHTVVEQVPEVGSDWPAE